MGLKGMASNGQEMARGIVVSQQHVIHCFSFMHSAAFWKEQRPLTLWKIICHDRPESNLVSFNNMTMHGHWEMTINPHGIVEDLKIRFHWNADGTKARVHKFKLVHCTNSWVCRPHNYHDADYTQWLIAVTGAQDAMPATAGIGGPPQQVVHCRSFKHSAADWAEDRTLSLWKIVATDGRVHNRVTFDGKPMHGQWELITNQDSQDVECLMIKFHFKANELEAQWHDFKPEASTNSWLCRTQLAKSTMWLIALVPVQEVM